MFLFQTTPVELLEEMVLCHACKKSGPTIVATFDLYLPEGTETPAQVNGASGQQSDDGSFIGHMEMYYFTRDDEPVTIMQAHLDMNKACCRVFPDHFQICSNSLVFLRAFFQISFSV